jgi:hypothetical protein
MDEGLENTWLMDSDCSRHMIGDKKWFSNLISLSHKEYLTFEDDKKVKVLGTDVIKLNNHFILNYVALVDKLRYNLKDRRRQAEGEVNESQSKFIEGTQPIS